MKIEIYDQFTCSIERAFSAPIFGDATKFLDGYLLQPAIIGFQDDETWGKIDGIRYPVTKGNMLIPRGRIFTDKIIEKNDNNIWKWVIFDIKIPLLFFIEKAIGEWEVKQVNRNNISVRYAYTFYSKYKYFHFLTVIFGLIQWKGMMKKALKGIKIQAESHEKFIYDKR